MIEIKEANPKHRIMCDDCVRQEEPAVIQILARVGELNLCQQHFEELREKLSSISEECWLINYDDMQAASGIAVVNSSVAWVGLYDRTLDYAYIAWATDGGELASLLALDPLRFLLFRFPEMPTTFLPLRALTSKWYRWNKPGELLLAFNALERRLTGSQHE